MALSVADLLASGRLERIAPDRSAALVRIEKAERHLVTAQAVPDPSGSVGKFQRMRSKRNATEYRDLVVGDQEIASDLVHATTIVTAVRADLGI